MQNLIFDMIQYVSTNGENDFLFHQKLQEMTKEEIIKQYLQIKRKEEVKEQCK